MEAFYTKYRTVPTPTQLTGICPITQTESGYHNLGCGARQRPRPRGISAQPDSLLNIHHISTSLPTLLQLPPPDRQILADPSWTHPFRELYKGPRLQYPPMLLQLLVSGTEPSMSHHPGATNAHYAFQRFPISARFRPRSCRILSRARAGHPCQGAGV